MLDYQARSYKRHDTLPQNNYKSIPLKIGGDKIIKNSRAHVLISGRVQGVWFRASTKDKAEELGIKGWVRNTPDGKVEAVFEGPKEKVDEIIKWCHKGPVLARVTNVEVKWEEPKGESEDFKIIY